MIRNHSRRCRDCIHFVLGYNRTTQVEPTYVCARQEKRIYRGDYNGVRNRKYYFAAKPFQTCENFEPKKIDGNKKV